MSQIINTAKVRELINEELESTDVDYKKLGVLNKVYQDNTKSLRTADRIKVSKEIIAYLVEQKLFTIHIGEVLDSYVKSLN